MKLSLFFFFALAILGFAISPYAYAADTRITSSGDTLDCAVVTTTNLNDCINLGYVAPLATGNIALTSTNSSSTWPGNFTVGAGNHLLINGNPVPGDIYIIYAATASLDPEGRSVIAINQIWFPALWQTAYGINPVDIWHVFPQETSLPCGGDICGPGQPPPGSGSAPCEFPAPSYCESGDL
jgi:hypothetical protein